jgi:hypothetical protein
MAYQNHYGCGGFVFLAGCDADCHYNIFSCMYSGSMNDFLAWDISEASKVVEHPSWPSDFYVISDEALFAQITFSLLIWMRSWSLEECFYLLPIFHVAMYRMLICTSGPELGHFMASN